MSWHTMYSVPQLQFALHEASLRANGIFIGAHLLNESDTWRANGHIGPLMGPTPSRPAQQRLDMTTAFLEGALTANGECHVRLGASYWFPRGWTVGDDLEQSVSGDSGYEWEEATTESMGSAFSPMVWPDTDYEPEPEPAPNAPTFTDPVTGRPWLWFGGSSWAWADAPLEAC
jgi:hypothetical protein